MTNELKPCPFCGGEAYAVDALEKRAHAVCDTCHASTAYYFSEAEAIEAWNTRAEPQKVAIANVTFTQEQLDEIKEYCLRNLSRYTPVEVVG